MEPLDLRKSPPRRPRAALDGLTFLPRTIDKVRASLPGGDMGVYQIRGFSEHMLDTFGVTVEDFTAAVAAAGDEAEVAAFLRARVAPEKFDEFNAWIAERQPRGGNRQEAEVSYPWLKERPDLILALDILEEDDRRIFA